jgi:hypothetical protein
MTYFPFGDKRIAEHLEPFVKMLKSVVSESGAQLTVGLLAKFCFQYEALLRIHPKSRIDFFSFIKLEVEKICQVPEASSSAACLSSTP